MTHDLSAIGTPPAGKEQYLETDPMTGAIDRIEVQRTRVQITGIADESPRYQSDPRTGCPLCKIFTPHSTARHWQAIDRL